MKWVIIGLAVAIIAIIGIAFLVQSQNPVFYSILPKVSPNSVSQESQDSLNKIIEPETAGVINPSTENANLSKQVFSNIQVNSQIKTNDYRFNLSGVDLIIQGNSELMIGSGIIKSEKELTLAGFNGAIELRKNVFELTGSIKAIKTNEIEIELSNTDFKANLFNGIIKSNQANISFLKANATGQIELPKLILKLDNDAIQFKKFTGSIELDSNNQVNFNGIIDSLETITDNANISITTNN